MISQFFNLGCPSNLIRNSSNPFYLYDLIEAVTAIILNLAKIVLAGIDGTITPLNLFKHNKYPGSFLLTHSRARGNRNRIG